MKTTAQLTKDLKDWTTEQGLPYESADELLYSAHLNPDQRYWLVNFSDLWNFTQAYEDEEAFRDPDDEIDPEAYKSDDENDEHRLGAFNTL